jgi:Family of unknown function (DUF6152)
MRFLVSFGFVNRREFIRTAMGFRWALLLAVISLYLVFSAPVSAHHSFGGTYDVTKEFTIKGKLAQVSMRSPHSTFVIQADDASGSGMRWSVEAAAVRQFERQGFAKDAFKAGEAVEIICNPDRKQGSMRARMVKITRTADGKSAMFDLAGESLGPVGPK